MLQKLLLSTDALLWPKGLICRVHLKLWKFSKLLAHFLPQLKQPMQEVWQCLLWR